MTSLPKRLSQCAKVCWRVAHTCLDMHIFGRRPSAPTSQGNTRYLPKQGHTLWQHCVPRARALGSLLWAHPVLETARIRLWAHHLTL